MALILSDIAVVSQLLDQVLALPADERETWLAALPAEHQQHRGTLRDMLAQEARLHADPSLDTLPRLSMDESVAYEGDRIGPYGLIKEIGRGGMGSVWLAERADGAYKRQVALKLPRLAWGAGLAERMAREREIGMLLEHPNIARLYDAGVDERGRPYLALEFVHGQPIDAWCEAQVLNVRERLKLFVQVIRAVGYAHGRLVVHRDLKPSNVLVTPDGQAHLLDFGIAKLLLEAVPGEPGLTQAQGRVLTPHYASPEQVAGEAITVQSDVYSLGVLLYELLTGTLPIAPVRGTLGAVEAAILEGNAPPASSRVQERSLARTLRGEIDAILAQAMRREPARRYATADAMAADIERYLKGETVAARPDSRWYRLRKAVRRNWVAVSAAVAVLVAVLSGSGVAVVQAQRAASAAERERVVKAFVADVFRINSRVDPKNAELRPATPQALIENGAQLIQQRFAGQPALQAELFGVVGEVFTDMGAHKLAADYASRRVEALTTSRAEPDEQAKGLLALGQSLFDDGRSADAEPRARRALELTPKGSPTHIDALVLQARIQQALGKREALTATLEQIDRQLALQGSGPTVAQSWVLYLRAREWTRIGRFDAALPLWQQAIDIAVMSEGPLSSTAIMQRLSLANRLVALTPHIDTAQQQFDAAISALRQLGGVNEMRAAFASASFAERRYAGSSQVTADEAIATIEHSRHILASSNLPVPRWYAMQLDVLLSDVLLRSGRVAQSRRVYEAVAPELRQAAHSADDRWLLADALGSRAQLVGQHDLADRWLRERLALRSEMGMADQPYLVVDHFVIAENLTMWGKTAQAEAVLNEAFQLEATKGDSARAARYTKLLHLGRARALLASGKAGEALQILQGSAPAADDDKSEWTDYRATLGEALCAAGQFRDGIVLLQQAVEADQPKDYAHAPWLARRRAWMGLCAAGLGDRRLALRYAAQAREDLVAQPEVSPYYKAPLLPLERLLGLKLPVV